MKLNIVMEKPSVVVITPTTGDRALNRACVSVNNQKYDGKIKHLVVIDGPEYWEAASKNGTTDKQTYMVLPENVGKNGFYGHRVYAGVSHLVNEDIVMFLDQDAFYSPDHVDETVNCILSNKYDWAYSLRNIINTDGTVLCRDNSESLGEWPAYVGNENVHLIDTSCFAFRRQFLIQVASYWHWGWGGDRRFFEIIWKSMGHTNFGTTMKYTCNYMLGGNENSPKPDFFIRGNQIMEKKYEGRAYPWTFKSKPN